MMYREQDTLIVALKPFADAWRHFTNTWEGDDFQNFLRVTGGDFQRAQYQAAFEAYFKAAGGMITCPTCGSTQWDCLDESTVQCIDPRTNEEYTSPIGYMRCIHCGERWTDGGCDGSDREIEEQKND